MMQAFLILPVMAVVYLLAAPTGWWRRVWQTFLMGVSVLVAAGWWVAIVALTPGRGPTLCRRVAEQQHPQPDLRLQRLRPDHRERVGQRGRADGSPGACGARPASPGSSTPSSGT